MRKQKGGERKPHTLFPDQTVVTVVGVVCITQASMAVFEFEELVAVLSRMSGAEGGGEYEKLLKGRRTWTDSLVSLHGGQKNRQ